MKTFQKLLLLYLYIMCGGHVFIQSAILSHWLFLGYATCTCSLQSTARMTRRILRLLRSLNSVNAVVHTYVQTVLVPHEFELTAIMVRWTYFRQGPPPFIGAHRIPLLAFNSVFLRATFSFKHLSMSKSVSKNEQFNEELPKLGRF